jgi:hypothetical protein
MATTMQHTILGHESQTAVIIEYSPTQYTVTAFVEGTPTVAWDATTYADAERWAKAVIEYPS